MRHALHNSVQNLLNAHSGAGRCADNLVTLAAQKLYDLILHLIGHGALHIALVYDRDDLQVMLNGHVEVAYGLRLNALSGINHQDCALASGDGSAHFI